MVDNLLRGTHASGSPGTRSRGKHQFCNALSAALWLGVADFSISQIFAAQNDEMRQHLTCNISGLQPIGPTDSVTFRGTTAWAKVGINSKLGGIAVGLDLIDPSHPESPLPLIDARSAAGGAWQTSTGVADERNDRIVHFNQAAGNSAQNWGYQSAYSISADNGIVQQDWLPLYSNDYRHPSA